MLKQKIYDYFKKENEKNIKLNNEFYIAPSYLTDCNRKLYYKKKNFKESNPITEAQSLKMELGKIVHDFVENILLKIDNIKVLEVEGNKKIKEIIYHDLKWKYVPDCIIEMDNKKYIVEIKSVYANGFKFIEQNPKLEHLYQMYMYMQFEKIDNGIILYIGRDNGYLVEYSYNINNLHNMLDIKLKTFYNKINELKNYIEKDILPDKNFNRVFKNVGIDELTGNVILSENFIKDKEKYKSDWQCTYCNYRDECYKKEINNMKNNKFFINNQYIKE